MTEMQKLTLNVTRGCECHMVNKIGACESCPYNNNDGKYCTMRLAEDALKVINYWKGKYENTVLQQPMILNHSEPIRIELVDIKDTEQKTKAMAKLGNAANFATEALRETTKALRELKEEFDSEPPEIPEAVTAKWTYIKVPLGSSIWVGQCAHCGKVTTESLGIGYPKVCPHCKAVMTGVE